MYEEFVPEQELEEIEKQIAEEIMKEEFSSVKKEENYAQTEDMSNFDDNLLITEDIIEVANNNVVKAGPVANNPAGPVSTRQNAARTRYNLVQTWFNHRSHQATSLLQIA